MKKLISLIIITITCQYAATKVSAQTLHVESMATLYIKEASAVDGLAVSTPTLFVQGDILNNGTILNNGELQITGNMTNNGFYTSSGDDIFVGNAGQTINGDFTAANAFYNLVLNKSGTSLHALNNINIEEGIYLTDGVLMPNGNIIHLKNTAGNAVHGNAPSGSGNNFIAGALKHDITTGQSYTFYNGDIAHGNQKATILFNNTGGASAMDISYSSDSAGITNIAGCGGIFDHQTGIWTLSANGTNGTYDYSIVLEPGGANLAAINTGLYDGTLKDGIFVTDPCANTLGNYAAGNLNSFSQFKIASGNNVALPITVTSFTGLKMLSGDELSWTTGSEQNNAYFNLQHSTDAIHFTTVAKINSKAVNGNSSTALSYSQINANPAAGHNYYRLEQVDIDQKKSIHAEIIDLIRNEENSEVNIYPNPAKDLLHVEFYAAGINNAAVKISDMSGRLIKEVITKSVAGFTSIEVNLSELPNALYSVQVLDNDHLISVSKISKND